MGSKWKGPVLTNSLLRRLKSKSIYKFKNLKIWSRSATILPCFIGIEIFIHNGHQFKQIKIKKEIVNFKFGDFSNTRQINRRTH